MTANIASMHIQSQIQRPNRDGQTTSPCVILDMSPSLLLLACFGFGSSFGLFSIFYVYATSPSPDYLRNLFPGFRYADHF